MITDDREMLSAIRAYLADRIGCDRYEVWFGPSTSLAIHGESLVVTAPSQFFQDWLRAHFRRDLEQSAEQACGRTLAVEFRVGTPAVEQPAGRPVEKSDNTPRLAVAAPSAPAAVNATVQTVSPQSAESQPPAAPAAEPLRRKFHTLETFVVGNSNCLAHKAAEMSIAQPGAYSPLLLHGPTSTGKTHLLEGIYTAFRRSRPRSGAVLMSAEQFTSHFLQALHKSGMASFRARFRELDLLILDDLQFLAGKKATIAELQHTIDTLLRAGKQLVFTADRPPAALKMLGPELMARLSGGMVCRLEPAEYATRLGIIRHQAVAFGMNVPDAVQAYIASHFTTQARELTGALKRLHAASLAHNRPITLTLAEEALAELVDHQGHHVKLPDIEKAVCDAFGLEPTSLQSDRKGKLVSHPRMLAMYLARKYTRAPLTEIGSYFGKRSHSTVISAQKKIERWMTSGTSGSAAEFNLEETLRRVEAQLRAG